MQNSEIIFIRVSIHGSPAIAGESKDVNYNYKFAVPATCNSEGIYYRLTFSLCKYTPLS